MVVIARMSHYFPNVEYDEISDLAKEIYSKLPRVTNSGNIHISKVYGKDALDLANKQDMICSLRCHWLNYHYGNPFSSEVRLVQKCKDLVFVKDTATAVMAYIDWVLHSEHYRACWIRDMCKSGKLKGKRILYYKELREPSHANALDYLINEHVWIVD